MPTDTTTPTPVCAQCDAELPDEPETCPECGFHASATTGVLLVLFGGLLSLTVIGAIIGIPMMVAGLAQIEIDKKGTIATTN